MVLFYDESFPVSWSTSSVSLRHMPILHSEHVYLLHGTKGTYQRQGTAWTRSAGSRTITILPAMKSQNGNLLVVEYAYYEQAPPT